MTIFLKLGGSLITDKTGVDAVRPQVLARLAAEIQRVREERPDLRLVIGHGSGSYGHVAAARHGTRQGVFSAEQWRGFAEVSAAAATLNGLVREALRDAGVPAITFQPSASVQCENGQVIHLAEESFRIAIDNGLVPLVYGDVAVDIQRGGTIVSTEEVLGYLVGGLTPEWLLLAGETAGVLDREGGVIPSITRKNFNSVSTSLGGSRGTDVTGGMASKVLAMVELAEQFPEMRIRIFSGLVEGELERILLAPDLGSGTRITANRGLELR